MKKAILASTSTLYGENYLAYLLPVLKDFFKGVEILTFIPYARPNAISLDIYTRHTAQAFAKIGIEVKGLHQYDDPKVALLNAQGIFTGGGNTFLLVKELHDLGLMRTLKIAVESGIPYLGCSAGSNIGGINMQTTNDMPIVMPNSFETTALIPFNINAHYLDPIEHLKHNGEGREQRIAEFQHFNNIRVIGLREESYLFVEGDQITLKGPHKAKLFIPGEKPYDSFEIPN